MNHTTLYIVLISTIATIGIMYMIYDIFGVFSWVSMIILWGTLSGLIWAINERWNKNK
jgi:hypothetical protein